MWESPAIQLTQPTALYCLTTSHTVSATLICCRRNRENWGGGAKQVKFNPVFRPAIGRGQTVTTDALQVAENTRRHEILRAVRNNSWYRVKHTRGDLSPRGEIACMVCAFEEARVCGTIPACIHPRHWRAGADLQGTSGVENKIAMAPSIVARHQLLKEGLAGKTYSTEFSNRETEGLHLHKGATASTNFLAMASAHAADCDLSWCVPGGQDTVSQHRTQNEGVFTIKNNANPNPSPSPKQAEST